LIPLSIYKPQDSSEIERIELELTSTCNLKCPLCIREITGASMDNNYRPLEEVIAQLENYPKLRFLSIAGPISEPTSYPWLPELITYINKRNIEISLYINGDTRNDSYYRKLGVLFRNRPGYIYFTICGSTQELHERYRVNSKLDRVIRRLEIVNKYSNNRGILTWIVFNYNEEDFLANYQRFKDKYRTEFFHTLPMDEHFNLKGTIRLPSKLNKIYTEGVDRTDFKDIVCPANKTNFVQISHKGEVNPCSLYRLYGESHCWECSKKNLAVLRNNKIFNVAEPEDEESATDLRLYYERYDEKK
jgi:MoaA/NifB/PqqE/SkfB family radical SAM enzyme